MLPGLNNDLMAVDNGIGDRPSVFRVSQADNLQPGDLKSNGYDQQEPVWFTGDLDSIEANVIIRATSGSPVGVGWLRRASQ